MDRDTSAGEGFVLDSVTTDGDSVETAWREHLGKDWGLATWWNWWGLLERERGGEGQSDGEMRERIGEMDRVSARERDGSELGNRN